MTEVLKALRLAGRAFGDSEARQSGADFERALAIKIETLRPVLVGVGIHDESVLKAFERAAHAAWRRRQGGQLGRLKQPHR
jgi:hypothetical protein